MVTKEAKINHKAASSVIKDSDKSASKKSAGVLFRHDSPRKVTSLSAAKAASKVLQNAKASAKIKKAADCAMPSKAK